MKISNSRPCPDAKIIEEHLRTVAGFKVTITSKDKVCYSCYKSHLVILQGQKKIDRGSELQSIVDKYKQKIATVEQHITREQARETAMNKTTVHVGEKLLRGKAMLLPDAHDFFIEKHEEILAAFDLLEPKTDTEISYMYVTLGTKQSECSPTVSSGLYM